MANSASRRKWIWPAVLLNVLVFGLGYLYVGNGKRPWFCIGLAVSSVLLRAARFADWLALIGYLIFLVAISWDVFKDASGFNFALSRACRAEAQRTYPAGTA